MAARAPYFAAEESARGIRKGESPAAALRRILATPGAHQAPCCYDALGARLVERAGFPIGFMGGASVRSPILPRVRLSSRGGGLLLCCISRRSSAFLSVLVLDCWSS